MIFRRTKGSFIAALALISSACASIDHSSELSSEDHHHESTESLSGVVLPPGSHPKAMCPISVVPTYNPSSNEVERDNIYQLVAYGVVLKDWQTKTWTSPTDPDPARGYNIGSILVDNSKPLGQGIACWGRNSVIVTGNETQHGEVRLMTNYLSNAGVSSLKDHNGGAFKLYTTLEPCAMCGGMMTLQNLGTTLYGQTDPDFGDGIQRLEVNTHDAGGFCPYPRGVYSAGTRLPILQQIDNAYAAWQAAGNRGLTSWLITDEAEWLYDSAVATLENWQVQYPENAAVLSEAKSFLLNVVPDSYTPIPYTIGCSGR